MPELILVLTLIGCGAAGGEAGQWWALGVLAYGLCLWGLVFWLQELRRGPGTRPAVRALTRIRRWWRAGRVVRPGDPHRPAADRSWPAGCWCGQPARAAAHREGGRR